MRLISFCWLALICQLPPVSPGVPKSKVDESPPEKSAYLAFVDHDYMFTIEVVKPGVPLLNFVCLADTERPLSAKEVRVTLENRKVPVRFFIVDTGDPKQPITTPSLKMRSRSSFGVTLQGDFGDAGELFGATVTVGSEELKLVPLTSFAFENLALKINRLNLGSPDFSDDWRALKFELIGSRNRIRRTGSPPRQ
jgi:hypothetical protein